MLSIPQGHKHSPAKLLSPEEVEELVPILNMEGVKLQSIQIVFVKCKLYLTNQQIHGGLLTPNEGHIDPYSLTQVSLELSSSWMGS